MSTNDIHAQLEEERRIIDAYPCLHLEVDSIPETGERGVIAYEAHDEDDELLSFSHVLADDMNAAEATRLARSWNALPVRNAQVKAVLALHSPRDEEDNQCAGCLEIDPGGYVTWPCPTVLAIEGAGK